MGDRILILLVPPSTSPPTLSRRIKAGTCHRARDTFSPTLPDPHGGTFCQFIRNLLLCGRYIFFFFLAAAAAAALTSRLFPFLPPIPLWRRVEKLGGEGEKGGVGCGCQKPEVFLDSAKKVFPPQKRKVFFFFHAKGICLFPLASICARKTSSSKGRSLKRRPEIFFFPFGHRLKSLEIQGFSLLPSSLSLEFGGGGWACCHAWSGGSRRQKTFSLQFTLAHKENPKK